MKLLWILVIVGVFGVMAKKSNSSLEVEEEEEEVEAEEGDFIFTVVVLNKLWENQDFLVVLSLEESLYPEVNFDITLHNTEEGEKELLANEEVTLEVDDLRAMSLGRMSDFPWDTVLLTIKVSPRGHPEITKKKQFLLRRATSELQVFIQAVRPDSGELFYRVLVVDENPQDPQFLNISVRNQDKSVNETLVKVPKSGIFIGSLFGKDGYNHLKASVISNVTSKIATSRVITFVVHKNELSTPGWLSVELQTERDVYFSQPLSTGSVILRSLEGVPLEGDCEVTLELDSTTTKQNLTPFRRKYVSRNLTLQGETPKGEFEFNVVKDLRLVRESAVEKTELAMQVTCIHRLSGSTVTHHQQLFLWKNLFDVGFHVEGPPEFIPKGNSSHPKTTVALKFLVERRDGGSVKENDPSKGLQVQLLYSNDTSRSLQPLATNFSLPIPENGVVKLEFETLHIFQFSTLDKVQLSVGDVVEVVSLDIIENLLTPSLHLSPLQPQWSIRRGDVVQFRLRSCRSYEHVNVILTSSNRLYSYQRFSFASKNVSGKLDEVIKITVPFNVTEGSLNLIVYGVNDHHDKSSKKSLSYVSAGLNVILSGRSQEIKIVHQVDDDMWTKVTFRLEGLPNNSVVALQGVMLPPLSEHDKERKWENRRLHPCEIYESSQEFSEIRDDSPGYFDVSKEVSVKSNVETNANYYKTDERNSRLFFFDVDKKTSKDCANSCSLEVSTTFDRLTEFGTFFVSAATFNEISGRTPMSNSPILRINPPPVTLTLSLPPSVILGETFQVLGYVKNNLDAAFQGHVTLEWSEGGTTEVTKELVDVKQNSFYILKFQVKPKYVGDMQVSLRSNISDRLTASKKVNVNPPGVMYHSTKYILINNRKDLTHWYANSSESTFELPENCSVFGDTESSVYEEDLLGDVFAFTQNELFNATEVLGGIVPRLQILSSLHDFYESKKLAEVRKTIRSRAWDFRIKDNYTDDSSIAEIASKLMLGEAKIPTYQLGWHVGKRWAKLTSMQMTDGSFQFLPAERTSTSNRTCYAREGGRQLTAECANQTAILDTVLALLSLQKVNGSKIYVTRYKSSILNFPAADLNRGVEFLLRVTAENRIEDIFALSVVAYFFSQFDDRDDHPFLRQLESVAEKDSDGTFWMAEKTPSGIPVSSIQATSFALMTYVNHKKFEEAHEVARWLVSKKNADGCYGFFEDTAAAVESLSKYASFLATMKSNWPSLGKLTRTCVTPQSEASTDDELSVKASLEKEAGELSLEICLHNEKFNRPMVVEVVLPSGYYRHGDQRRHGSFRFTQTPNKCSNFIANRMFKVISEIPQAPTGSVTYYDFQNSLTRNEISFIAT